VFFVPATILILLSSLLAIHVLRTWLAPEMDQFTVIMFGIVPGRYMPGVISAFPGGVWSALPTLISYAFLHAGYTHLAINSAWLLAFGSYTVRKIGTPRFLTLYLICAIVAGAVHILAFSGSLTPMIGASGAISGLMGAGFRLYLQELQEAPRSWTQHPGMGHRSGQTGLVPLRDRRFLMMSGAWLLGNVLFGLTGIQVSEQVLMIAWDAHIAGFVTGAILIGLLMRAQKVSSVTQG